MNELNFILLPSAYIDMYIYIYRYIYRIGNTVISYKYLLGDYCNYSISSTHFKKGGAFLTIAYLST